LWWQFCEAIEAVERSCVVLWSYFEPVDHDWIGNAGEMIEIGTGDANMNGESM
jgi:hypothetical protein